MRARFGVDVLAVREKARFQHLRAFCGAYAIADSTRRRSERSSRDKPSVCHRSLAVTTEKKSRHSVLATKVCLPEMNFTRSVSSASSSRSSTAKIACDAGCDHHDPFTGSRATIPATLGNTGLLTRSSPCRSSSRRTPATLKAASYPQRDGTSIRCATTLVLSDSSRMDLYWIHFRGYAGRH